MPANHPLAGRPNLHVSDFAGERFILHRPGQNTRKLIDRYLFKQRVTPRIAIELAETEAIKAMVARGLGVSILPEGAVLGARDQKEVHTFRIPRKDLKRSMAVVYPKPQALRAPAVALVEMLQNYFRAKPKR
jgi:DNA-binding transcriptional LysR family regulator